MPTSAQAHIRRQKSCCRGFIVTTNDDPVHARRATVHARSLPRFIRRLLATPCAPAKRRASMKTSVYAATLTKPIHHPAAIVCTRPGPRRTAGQTAMPAQTKKCRAAAARVRMCACASHGRAAWLGRTEGLVPRQQPHTPTRARPPLGSARPMRMRAPCARSMRMRMRAPCAPGTVPPQGTGRWR